MPDIIFSEEDLPYEEEILRNPFSVKHWLRYIEHKKEAPKTVINLIYERALKELPGSYKLWYHYLKLRRQQVKGRCVTDPGFEDVNNAFERSLVFMHKMPRIWLDYCQFLMDQRKITRTRWAFDRALRALPITQHRRIWPLYLQFVKTHNIHETAGRVYKRYLKLCPENAEEYIEYLKSVGRLDEAAVKLAHIVNKDDFVSKEGKSNHQLWNELCELISKNPDQVHSLKVDAIIRGGLHRYTDQLGQLWNSLADYYIRSGLFERARDIYEEAIQTVTTVRDFTQVFDAYAQFEESMISAKMETSAELGPSEEDDVDLDLRLARFEALMDRRPLLLNSVLLRQNPHNVHEWHKRVKLFEGKPKEVINTYTEAVQTVTPKLATGKLHTLWIAFARFYEDNGQIEDVPFHPLYLFLYSAEYIYPAKMFFVYSGADSRSRVIGSYNDSILDRSRNPLDMACLVKHKARIIFEQSVQVAYTKVDDLASVWCEWAEMELRHENYEDALKLMHRATTPPSRKVAYYDETETVQMRLHKSLKVWSMYADLEESFGTFKSCKAVYDRILDLKIATPQIIINYGLFLEENNYFEDAFKAYEKGIAMFRWPNVYDIWNTYLTKFLGRYGGKKLERARDLFEQCLSECPAKFAKAIFLLYAKLEEDHGLARHAMSVFDRATRAVLPEEQFEMFNIYIRKAAEIYGITNTREIYEKAIEMLPDNHAREMCLRFSDMERKLGEVDRARAIYAHCSQMCDPRTTSDFWQTWKEFEIRHGNEDTMREMLRIKRSVQATYNTQVNFMSAQMLAASSQTTGTISDLAPGLKDDMRMLEAKVAQLVHEARNDPPRTGKEVLFVRGSSQTEEQQLAEMSRTTNPEEIAIDEDYETDEDDTIEEIRIEQQAIPSEVFGNLQKQDTIE